MAEITLPSTEPIFGYGFTNAFPGLSFDAPVALVSPPGETNRLFVLEKPGRVVLLRDLASQPTASTFLDLRAKTWVAREAGLLGLAFHPGFATNGRFFVYRTVATQGLRTQLSEFRCDPPQAEAADPSTEKVIISQLDGEDTHNAGQLQFGPDGYLYLGIGDELPVYPDTHDTPQAIDKGFFGGIFRIDIDSRPDNLPPNPHPAVTSNYRVPKDNPFVGVTEFNGRPVRPDQVRTEFYAVGLRNPWRFSFDPVTGRLVCADVGGANFEEIDLIEAGANYGWPYLEANSVISTEPRPSGLKPPVFSYSHGFGPSEGNVIIGGLVYRGNEFADLAGQYLFADFVAGNVWAIDLDSIGPHPRWLTARSGISTFGMDPSSGGILVANHDRGWIERLIYRDPVQSGVLSQLSEVGAFTNLALPQPGPTTLPYDVIQPLWSDGAIKQRWIDLSRAEGKIRTGSPAGWTYPAGAIWIKHFELELTNSVSTSRRRIETRFLVKTKSDAYGLTYRWNSAGTEATLVPPQGAEESFELQSGGVVRQLVWRYPSQEQCRICHNPTAGYVLGFIPPQLNTDLQIPSGQTNQLDWLSAHGCFEMAPDPSAQPRLASLSDPHAPLLHKARSYLQSNCAQCHRPGGRAITSWDARITTPLASAAIVDAPAVFYPLPAKIIAPRDLANSHLLARVADRTPWFQMPPIATTLVDEAFLSVLTNWISSMPAPPWISTNIGSALAEGAAEQKGRSFRLSSAGAGVESNSMLLLAREVAGTVEFIARLDSLESDSPRAEAGIFVRSSLDSSAPSAAILIQGGQLRWMASASNSPPSVLAALPRGSTDRLRILVDSGQVSAWSSIDGLSWQFIGQTALDLGSSFFTGFTSASGGAGVQFASAVFSDYSLKTVRLTLPPDSAGQLPSDILIAADVFLDETSRDPALTLRNQNETLTSLSAPPWQFVWTNAPAGEVLLQAVLTSGGSSITSVPVTLHLDAEPPLVTLLPEDTATVGRWSGRYGGTFALIPETLLKSSGSIAATASGNETVLGPSSLPAALQIDGQGIAAQIHQDGDLELSLSGGAYKIHQCALYFFDWLDQGQTQTLSFWAPGGTEPLAQTSVNSQGGVYIRFAFRAPVTVRVQNSTGESYLSGVFIDVPEPLSVSLLTPSDGAEFQQPASVPVSVLATAPGRDISRVEIWIDDVPVTTFDAPPYSTALTNLFRGNHTVRASVRGTYGYAALSEPARISLVPPVSSASFIGADTNTLGWWKGRYGSGGFWIIGDWFTLPVWLDLVPEGAQAFVYSDDTTQPEALQRASDDSRLAHVLVGNPSFSIALTPLDGRPVPVGFYLVDIDQIHRAMDVVVEDPFGTVLDRQEVTDFASGRYLFWKIQGEVSFRFVSKAGNAVISGIFLDPGLSPSALELNNRTPPGYDALRAIPDVDSDGDGVSNGIEYFLGFDPLDPNQRPSVRYFVEKKQLAVSFSYRTFAPDGGITFDLSSNLVDWVRQPPSATRILTQGSEHILTFYFDPGALDHLFVRIKALEVPDAAGPE